MTDSFFVILPSSDQSFDNKQNDFKILLPRPLKFDGDYVCALKSISYMTSWDALGSTHDNWLRLHFSGEHFPEEHRKIMVPIPKGTFNTVDDLLRVLNKKTQVYYNRHRKMYYKKKIVSKIVGLLTGKGVQKRSVEDYDETVTDAELEEERRERDSVLNAAKSVIEVGNTTKGSVVGPVFDKVNKTEAAAVVKTTTVTPQKHSTGEKKGEPVLIKDKEDNRKRKGDMERSETPKKGGQKSCCY